MSAALALAEAIQAGVHLQLAPDGKLKVKGPSGAASPALLDQLRAHKAELLEMLRGDCCRHCSERIPWSQPYSGVTHADGMASCYACYAEKAAIRAVESSDALSDEAEVMLRGEALP